MGNCTRCGTTIDGEGLCPGCEAASHTSTDVPCQRCGMYLPPHELRMHNSRLYCAYCIMDVQDEERRQKEIVRQSGVAEESGRGERQHGEQGMGKTGGTCERCGRQADKFYTAFGRNLCASCYFEGEHEPESAKPSIFGQVIRTMKKALGMKGKPKIITNEAPPEVFDLRKRKMVGEKEAAKEKEIRMYEEKEEPGAEEEQGPAEEGQHVFDLRGRKMVGKKADIFTSQPLKEGKQEERKASKKSKKAFYSLHKAVPRKVPAQGGAAPPLVRHRPNPPPD